MQLFTRLFFILIFSLISPAVFAQITANFTSNVTVGCSPLLVQFTSTSTGNPTTYSWNLGNSATSVLANPSTTYTTPGTYTVTLTVSNGSSSNTKTVTNYITVLGSPVVNFTATDTAGCPPFTTQFNNTSNPVTPGTATYNWSFGDGNSSTIQNPSHTFALPGYYNITLICTNSGGCVKSLTRPAYIHVYTPPVGNFSVSPTFLCDPPATANFTTNIAGSGPYTFLWNFGDLTTGTGNNPSHTYNNPGTYAVSMLVTDVHGCKDTVVNPSAISVGSLNAAFTGPSSACVHNNVTFANTSTAALTNVWDFGDGTIISAGTGSHTYITAGVYTVKLKVTNSGCVDSFMQPITIYPQPEADFLASPLDPCPAPQTIQFTNLTTGGTNYQWYFGDGGTSTAFSPSHTYNANGLFGVTLIVTSANGCKDTVAKPQYIKLYDLKLEAGAVPYQGCVPLEVKFTSATFTNIPAMGNSYPYPTATWSWAFGDGGTSNLDTPTHVYTAAGTYTVVLNITTINGCTASDTFQILVGTLPTAAFTASPDTICVNHAVHFTNASTGATSYIWEFGDNGSTGATNPTYTYNTSGIYTVILHAFNNGCEDTFMVQQMITVLPPTALFNIIYSCDTPLKVRFQDTSIGATSRVWHFGDGGTDVSLNPVHIYPALGSYNVMLITQNSTTGCIDTTITPITLINPVPSFVANDTAICHGDTIMLQASYTGIATDYDWLIGNTFIIDSGSHVTWPFPNAGLYTVKVFIKDIHDCLDTLRKTNYILVADPVPVFTGVPTVGCVPLTVQFTDQTTNTPGAFDVTRQWSFGGGGFATVTTPSTSYTYNNAGFYDVKLIVTDNVGCKDSLLKPAYIEARKPVANFSANDTSACIGQSILFSNTSAGAFLSAQWNFGDNTTSTLWQPTHAYTQTGNYTVRLIVTDPTGCKDTLIRNNFIDITKPDANFTMSDTFSICPPLQVFFTNITVGGISYTWNFGNSSSSTLMNPDNVYSSPGIFTVTMIAMNGEGCKDTATGTVNVLGYAGGLSYSPLSGCAPLTVAFVANLTNVPSIVWDFSDGVTAPAFGSSTTNHTYVTPGTYIPKLILSDGAGCLNSSNGIDTIKVDGVLPGFISSPLCENTIVNFQDTSYSYFSPVASWYWSFNNGQQTSTSSNPGFIFPGSGNYPVTLVVMNANGCTDTLLKTVYINPLPVIDAGMDTIICVNDAAQLLATGGVSYEWSPALPPTLSCINCPNPVATPSANTSYTVIGTDANGCKNNDNVNVTLQYVTTSVVGPGGEICDDSTFQLLASGAHVYLWKPASSLSDSTIANPVASPHTTTTYTVTAWEGSCPPDFHDVTVIVHPLPTINAGADQTVIAGKEAFLNASGSLITQFLWRPAVDLNCNTCSNPIATPKQTTSYIVTGYTNFGCRASDTVTIHVLCDQSQLFIPNSFTPNGDGNNDVFYARGAGLEQINSFRIYNRWGELVYEKKGIQLNDELSGWNGTYKGAQLPPDVFVYAIDATCSSGEKISWKGDISIIR